MGINIEGQLFRLCWRIGSVLVLVFVMTASLQAQSTALLTGTVVDPSGAVVPGAQVVCQNTGTGLKSMVTTNEQGVFRFPDLPIGDYEVIVSHAGFQTLARTGLQLLTGHSVDLRLELSVGATQQTVQVSAAAPVVQTTSSVMQTTIDSRNMRNLPLNGRNPLQLVALTPGTQVTAIGTFGEQEENSGVTANGLRAISDNYELDGISITNREYNSPSVLPNPDTLQEFTMKSSNYSASESGPGATMLLSTRSGTNQFHGDAFEFLRNNALDSRNYFAGNISSFKRNQFGGTFGGPIQKDKTFIFASYQATREVGAASSALATVPTLAERNGDFSASGKTIYDPTTGQPFADDMIPSGRLDALTQKLAPTMPLPNLSSNRAELVPQNKTIDNQWMAKLDRNFGTRDHFTARYVYDEYDFRRSPKFEGFYGQQNFLDQNLLVTDTHTFSPNLLFVGSFGYSRNMRDEIPVQPTTLQDLGWNVPMATAGALPSLRVSISNYESLSNVGALAGRPQTFQFRGRFTWTHGKHLVQFGMDVERDMMWAIDNSQAPGQVTFNGSRTGLTGCSKCGDSWADFLLGLPSLFYQKASSPQNFREGTWQPWIQDDWKVLPRLTLNLGLRWEPWLPPYDLLGPATGFEAGVQSVVAPLAPTGVLFSGDPGLRNSIWPADWNNLAPRVGLAWDVQGNGRTVVRSAFGIFYNTIPLNMARSINVTNPFRNLAVQINDPATLDDPYANFPGGDPFPWTPPPASALKTYQFITPLVMTASDPHAKTGYTEQWNFTLERQLSQSLGLSVAYVGNHQVDVMAGINANPAVYGPGATTGNTDSRRIYPGFSNTAIATPWVFANYHSLQVSVTKRATRGLSLIGNYVYSKCMDNESSNFEGAGNGQGLIYNNKFDINGGYARCDWNITHLANLSLIYDLPRVSSLRGAADRLINGWEATSILTVSSGSPFNLLSGRDNSLSGTPNNDSPDQILANAARPAGVGQLQQWFNTAAFVANATGQFGNVGRNSLTGPGAWNEDFGLIKTTPITERLRAEFRFEAFNLFNHANFGNPTATLTSGNFGKILGASNPRVIQFAMKLSF
jgi:Carboxypeptidase regulatory-like domain